MLSLIIFSGIATLGVIGLVVNYLPYEIVDPLLYKIRISMFITILMVTAMAIVYIFGSYFLLRSYKTSGMSIRKPLILMFTLCIIIAIAQSSFLFFSIGVFTMSLVGGIFTATLFLIVFYAIILEK